MFLIAVKDGVCPAVPEGTVGICSEFCSNDQECTGIQKCCSNGCGHTCVDPAPGKEIFTILNNMYMLNYNQGF